MDDDDDQEFGMGAPSGRWVRRGDGQIVILGA
jgi:hypothetical protein